MVTGNFFEVAKNKQDILVINICSAMILTVIDIRIFDGYLNCKRGC